MSLSTWVRREEEGGRKEEVKRGGGGCRERVYSERARGGHVRKDGDYCDALLSSDSPEEGEIRVPKLPRGSPPPEDEWAPCLRMVVSSSECVERGSVFVVTQEGAELGR